MEERLELGVPKDGYLLVGKGAFDSVVVVTEPVIFPVFRVLFVRRVSLLLLLLCSSVIRSEKVGEKLICCELGEVRFMESLETSLLEGRVSLKLGTSYSWFTYEASPRIYWGVGHGDGGRRQSASFV